MNWEAIRVDDDGSISFEGATRIGGDDAVDFDATLAHRYAAIEAAQHRGERRVGQSAREGRRALAGRVRA